MNDPAAVEAATRRWVERVVIGENLCPFARPVLPRMRIAVSAAVDLEGLIGDLGVELQRLLDHPPAALPTTLLVTPAMLGPFRDYLDALAVVEAAVEGAGLTGEVQVASFHPRYRFAGAPADDPANYTNRSPWPMFHLLREAEVSRAVDAHPDPEGIPERNMARMRALGAAGVRALLAGCLAAGLLVGCGGDEADAADAMVGVDGMADGMADDMANDMSDGTPDGMTDGMTPPDGTTLDAGAPDAIADATVDAIADAERADFNFTIDFGPDLGPDAPPDRGPDPHPGLSITHVQMRGTHNSYHIAHPITIDAWDYTHPPLTWQLERQGIRQFELDVHWHPEIDAFRVYHLPGVDALSRCDRFVDCVAEIDRWLRRRPDEGPVIVLVEPKDDADAHAVADHLPALDAEVRAAMAPWRLITPDELRGDHPDLPTAVRAGAWPSLHAARGRALFVLLDTGETRDRYVADAPTAAGRVFFPAADDDPSAPWGAVLLRDGAVRDAEGTRALAAEGYLVRTMADDAAEFDAARASGAHAISTDYQETLRFEGDAPLVCNPVTAPPECAGWLTPRR